MWERRLKRWPELRRWQAREPDEDERAISARLPGEDWHYQEEEVKRFYGWPDAVWAAMSEHERAVKRVHWREHHARKGLAEFVSRKHYEEKGKK